MVDFAPAGRRSEGDLGDLPVTDHALFVLVPDRVRIVDRGHVDSLMPEIALRTAEFIRVVIENRAPPRRAAAIT
jgi:hypothetical protein